MLRESPASSWLPVQRRAESIGMALFLIVVIAVSYLLVEMNVARVDDRMRDFVGVRQINGAGSFTVESFLVDGNRFCRIPPACISQSGETATGLEARNGNLPLRRGSKCGDVPDRVSQ